MPKHILYIHTVNGTTRLEVDNENAVTPTADRLALAGYALIEYFEGAKIKKRWVAGTPGDFFVQLNVPMGPEREPVWTIDRKVDSKPKTV